MSRHGFTCKKTFEEDAITVLQRISYFSFVRKANSRKMAKRFIIEGVITPDDLHVQAQWTTLIQFPQVTLVEFVRYVSDKSIRRLLKRTFSQICIIETKMSLTSLVKEIEDKVQIMAKTTLTNKEIENFELRSQESNEEHKKTKLALQLSSVIAQLIKKKATAVPPIEQSNISNSSMTFDRKIAEQSIIFNIMHEFKLGNSLQNQLDELLDSNNETVVAFIFYNWERLQDIEKKYLR